MLFKVAIVTDDDDAIAKVHQFGAQVMIASRLRRFVMHRAVAENADVWRVEKVRDAARLRDGLLRFVGQPMETCGESGEEIPLDVRARVGERAKPRQMGVPIAVGNAWEGAAVAKVKQMLSKRSSSK